MGTYLPSRLDTVLWGELPTRRTRPVLSVRLSQAVDRTVGVHGLISKADFRRS
jgi:hypothetical protein